MGQIDLFENYLYMTELKKKKKMIFNLKKILNNYTKKMNVIPKNLSTK